MVNRKHRVLLQAHGKLTLRPLAGGSIHISYFEAGQISCLSKSRHCNRGCSHERFTVLFVPSLGASHYLFPFTFSPTVKMARW